MQAWEYLTVEINVGLDLVVMVYKVNGEKTEKKITLEKYMAELGEQGWELVGVSTPDYYFKRPKISN